MSAFSQPVMNREELFRIYRADAESLVDTIYSPDKFWVRGSKEDATTEEGTIQKTLFLCDIRQFWFLRPINEFLTTRSLPKATVISTYNRRNSYQCRIILRITEDILKEQIIPFASTKEFYLMHRPVVVSVAERIFRRYFVQNK